MNILETITERTKERIRGEKKQIPINEIRKKAEEKASSDTTKFAFEQALRAEGLSFICEAKKASPSKGLIAPDCTRTLPFFLYARRMEIQVSTFPAKSRYPTAPP